VKASFLDLRRRMKDVLRALEKNEPVTLTYRGKEKGVIRPVKKRDEGRVASHPAFGLWKNREDLADVERAVDRLRKGRDHAV